MDKFDRMRAFVQVAELKSFSRAAEQLNVPNATVSNAVKELERRVNAQLLHRTTRVVELTAQGSAFLERCKNLLIDIDEAENMFRSSPETIRGKLRVGMTVGLASGFFMSLLPDFYEQFPNMEIELSGSDRHVDLIREGFDCVIRGGSSTDASLVSEDLGALEFINVASPAYLNEYGTPETLEDLDHHLLIESVQVLGTRATGFEYLLDNRFQTRKMAHRLTVDSIEVYLSACLAGLGIAQYSLSAIREALSAGELIEILPQYKPAPIQFSLVYPRQKVSSKRLTIFNRWLIEKMKVYLATRD